jgi:flagellar M-ring protein FliF
MLDRSQVAGIVHLVASSVPELDPSAVSVLDDTGKLLSASRDGNTNGIDAQQLQYAQQLEQIYSRRIVDLLEPIVGRNNVRAQVTADLDFSLAEQTSETYKPNGAPDSTAIRSQQTLDASNGSAGGTTSASGVPGATSNQPPGSTNTAVNGSAQNLTAAGAAGNGNARKESTVNYELDKTVRVVRAATPVVKRLTAAVVVNHQSVTDAKGKTSTNPWNDQQVQNMTALVREAIGFSKDRNDSVNLMNAPFTAEKVTIEDVPLWKQPQVQDLIHSLAWPMGTLLLAALALLGFVKPALKMLASAPAGVPQPLAVGVQLDAVEAEAPVLPQFDAPRVESALPTPHELAIEDARKLTRDNPAAVANIVKGWINGEA